MLIIEDERPLAHALELKFRNEGYETTVMTNGRDALEHIKNSVPCIILLDLIMPEMDGFAFLEQLQVANISTKVIVLTNLGQKEDEERVRTYANVVGYFVKSNTPIAEIVRKAKSVISS